VGHLVGYPSWSLTQSPDIPAQSFGRTDLPVGLNAVIPWGRPTVGIALTDGVGEIDVASSFEVYDVSYAARPISLSASGTITTKHGLVLHTNTLADGPTPSQLAVPGAATAALDPAIQAWAERTGVPVDAVHTSAPGFDGALEYLASTAGHGTAVSAGKMIDYPTAHLHLVGHTGVRTRALLALGFALATAAAAVPALIRRSRRSARGRA
jgi:hypothetical protein